MKMILLIAAVLLSAASVSAQKVKAEQVPAAVKAAFAKGFADKSAAWWSKSDNDQYDAVVLQAKQQTLHAGFTAAGELVFTCLHYPEALVPTVLKSKIGGQHPGYTVSYANEVNSKRYGRYYFVWLTSRSGALGVYVTPDGESMPNGKADPNAKRVEMGSN